MRMKLKILDESSRNLKFEIDGEGHSFCSILQQELLKIKGVEIAGYDQKHPLINKSIFIIKTAGSKKPRKVLKEALTNLTENLNKFSEEFETGISRFRKDE